MSTAVRSFSSKRLETAQVRPGANAKHEFRDVTLVLCDLVALLAGALILIQVRFNLATHGHISRSQDAHLAVACVYALLMVLCFHWQHLYRRFQMRTTPALILAVTKACTMATVLLIAILYFAHSDSPMVSRGVIAGLFATGVLEGTFLRLLRRRLIVDSVTAGQARNILIVGAHGNGRSFAEYLSSHKHFGYKVVGFLDSHRGADIIGRVEDVRSIVLSSFVDEIVVSNPASAEMINFLASELVGLDTGLSVLPETYWSMGFNAEMEMVGEVPRVVLQFTRQDAISAMTKRAIDVLASSILLVLISPALLMIALAIRLDSRGSILYYANRVGKKGRIFKCYKFRTMVSDAESLRETLNHLNERQGILFKIKNDPRITRVGRILRKYSLDELPQLFNVLWGDMSLVGPRPALPSEVEKYSPEHVRRMMVLPGITGLWQVQARTNPSFDTYIDLDLQYVERWSVWLDVQILARTLAVVVAGTGS